MGIYDIVSAGQTLADGNFNVVSDGVAAFSGGVNVLGVLLDPVSAVIGAPVEFLIEWLVNNVALFKVPLDALLGDPQGVHANGQRWSAIGSDTAAIGTAQQPTVSLVGSWTGPASDQYRQIHQQVGQTIASAKGTYDNFAQLSEMSAAMVGAIRGYIWGAIKDVIINAITSLVLGLINSFWSAGASVVAAVANVGFRIAATLSKITAKLGELLKALAETGKVGAKMAGILSKAADSLASFSATLMEHSNVQNNAGVEALANATDVANAGSGATEAYK